MLLAACFVVTAVMLWLAAGIAARADRHRKPLLWVIRGGAAALVACALWWPPHTLHAEGTLVAAEGPMDLLGWLPALAFALVALATARPPPAVPSPGCWPAAWRRWRPPTASRC